MECAASTDMVATAGMPFDGGAAYRLDPAVAIRVEPFGALAYHYGNRRLTFLRSPDLVALVRNLEDHDSAEEALAASDIDPARWPAIRRALASLSQAEVLRAR
jgi:mycofactocin biosynthesis protein MftB